MGWGGVAELVARQPCCTRETKNIKNNKNKLRFLISYVIFAP